MKAKCKSASVAKALAIREAVHFLQNHALENVLIESDAKTVIESINSKEGPAY